MSKYQTKNVERMAGILKALSNPHRLKLYLALITCCVPGTSCCDSEETMTQCVGDLGKELDLAPSTVSHHLKELRNAGLLHMERQGQRIECHASVEAFEFFTGFFSINMEICNGK